MMLAAHNALQAPQITEIKVASKDLREILKHYSDDPAFQKDAAGNLLVLPHSTSEHGCRLVAA